MNTAALYHLQTEEQFMREVVNLAHLFHWRTYHTRNSKGSDAGFPDLVLVRRPRVLFVELKTERGKLTHDQFEWLAALDRLHLKPLWPRWTVQAYVTRDLPRHLLSVAVASTVGLFAHIRTGREGSSWWVNRTENAEFLCVAWDELPSYWVPFIWRSRS